MGSGGVRRLPVRPDRRGLGVHRQRGHLGQRQRVHRRRTPPRRRGRRSAFLQGTGSVSQTVAGACRRVRTRSPSRRRSAEQQQPRDRAEPSGPGRRLGRRLDHPDGDGLRVVHDRGVHRLGRPHTVTFQGMNAAGGDNTAFVDNVQLALTSATPTPTPTPTPDADAHTRRPHPDTDPDPDPDPDALADDPIRYGFRVPFGGLGRVRRLPVRPDRRGLGVHRQRRASRATPAGSPRQPRRPGGDAGRRSCRGPASVTQTVAGLAAGSYQITFSAAQREQQQPRHGPEPPGPGRRLGGRHDHSDGYGLRVVLRPGRSRSRPARTPYVPGDEHRRGRQHRLRR